MPTIEFSKTIGVTGEGMMPKRKAVSFETASRNAPALQTMIYKSAPCLWTGRSYRMTTYFHRLKPFQGLRKYLKIVLSGLE